MKFKLPCTIEGNQFRINQRLNIRAKTIKVLSETIGVNLYDLRVGSGFLHMIPKAKEKKTKINWSLSQLIMSVH